MRQLDQKPLTRCVDLVAVANKLKIDDLRVGLEKRTARILAGTPQFAFSLDPGDIKYIFTELGPGHKLGRSVVRAVAVASVHDLLHPKFRAKVQELKVQLPEFDKLMTEIMLI